MSSVALPVLFDPDRVVVPLDGSAVAEAGLTVGARLAEGAGARLVVVRAIDPATEDVADCRTALQLATVRAAVSRPATVEVHVGRAADVVLEVTGARGLVSMASHGRSGLARLTLGSVAEEVVRRATGPVVLVGPGRTTGPTAARLLLGTDGSALAAGAAPAAAAFARRFDLDVTILMSVGPDEGVQLDETPPGDRARASAQRSCDRLRWPFEAAGVDVTVEVAFGDPARTVAERAAALQAAYVAVASRGRTGLGRLTMGSTAAAIVRRSPCPVLVVGPAANPAVEDGSTRSVNR